MKALKSRLLITTIAFGLIVGGLGGIILHYLLPQFYPTWYLGIVFFFLIVETCLIYGVATYAQKVTSVKMVNLYMLAKVLKILLSLGFILIYYLNVREGIKNFVLIFVIFYALYLFIETYLFSIIEKSLKTNGKK